MSFFDDAIGTIGKGLAETATRELSDATGYDIGGTLNFLFGNNQATGGEDLSNLMNTITQNFTGTSADLNFLKESLSQQGQVLSDIGGQLTSIIQTVNSISLEITKIQNLLTQIQQQQLFQNWQNVDLQLNVYTNAINSAYKTYSEYIQNYSTTPNDEIQLLKGNILDVNDGPIVGMNGISLLILDNGLEKGALQLWSNMVCALVNAGVMDYRDAVDQYMDYYKKLTFAQLTATNLVMEAYNLEGDVTSSTNFYDSYKTTVLAQETTFINWLVPIVYAGITGNMFDSNNHCGFTAIDASTHLNPTFSTLANGTEYYTPSSIFYEAERLLKSLYCTDVADRRIVVYMTYFGYPSISNLLQTVQLSLTSIDNQPPILPQTCQTLGAPFGYPQDYNAYPDANWDSDAQGFYIKRHVYFANEESLSLPDNVYQLTNLNSTGNLIPMETYASAIGGGNRNPIYGGKAPFMTNSVLAYQLSVNESSNFDFMNFLAYNYPSSQLYYPGL
jgi:hypothetical protein